MLPTIDQLPQITRFELEFLGPACVRLIGWAGADRDLVLTADPRKPGALRELLSVPEVLLTGQAGGNPEPILSRLREERHGPTEHRR